MKQIILCLLLCAAGHRLIGQVVIIPLPHQEGFLTLDDLWRVNLVSSQAQNTSVRMEVTIEDVQHRFILSASSPAFNLLQGTNRPTFNASGSRMQYGSGVITNVLRSTGRFPYGNYIVCYRVLATANDAFLGEFCQEETIKPFSPPELVSPYNKENIITTLPLLTWKPPFPPGAIPFEYTIKLVEVRERQDALEALESNPLLIGRRGIFSTVLPYPGDAPKLEVDKTYAWQVSARSGDFDLGSTEVWTFKIRSEAEFMMPPSGLVYNSYRELKLAPNGSFNPIKQKLKFVYNNRWHAPNLDYESTSPPISNLERAYYKIYPAGKQDAPISTTGSIALIEGNNKLSINLNGLTGINDGDRYILVLRDPVGKAYYLEFTYFN